VFGRQVVFVAEPAVQRQPRASVARRAVLRTWKGLLATDRKLPGFAGPDVVLITPETQTPH
jgi:hypothetical protein